MASEGIGGPGVAVADSGLRPSPNGNGKAPVGVPLSPRRPRNTLWIIAGVVLVVISGLAAATIARSLSNRVDVLVASRTIAEGEVINDADLRTESIAATGVRAISPSERVDLVGQVATGPIGEGSIVHPSQFIEGNAEDQPQVIVGAALDPGQYPLVGLRPGDVVKVIEVSGPNAAFTDTASGPREITEGTVVEVNRLVRADTFLVSIRVNEAIATPISERAQQGRIRLALIDDGLLDDPVVPIDPGRPAEPGEPSEPGS